MTDINCKEIYYASTEKSILTGYAGFGVRTYTTGIAPEEINEIVDRCSPGYNVDTERMLTFEQISNNPRVVYDFAPSYALQKVVLGNGATRYVLSRTVYIGIDYGYFAHRDGAMRTGSNYFTHMRVFDQIPPHEIFAEITGDTLFVPKDYTCSPDNAELQALLTGEPQLLPVAHLQIDDNIADMTITPDMAQLIIAMLQAYGNGKRGADDAMQKIIIKAPEDRTPQLLKVLAILPHEITDGKRFTTNYTQGYGVPDEYDMVFVNEHNQRELYEDCHICINLFDGRRTNIDDNIIYQKIAELADSGDIETLKRLINYYIKLDFSHDLDYELLYSVFVAIHSDKKLPLDILTANFISSMAKLSISNEQQAKLQQRISEAINHGLCSTRGSEVIKAIDIIGLLKTPVQLLDESRKWMTQTVLFGETSYLGKVVTANNVDTVLTIIDRNQMTSDALFFDALMQSTDKTVWAKLLKFYLGDDRLVELIDKIIDNIMQSPIPATDKCALVCELYPVERFDKQLLAYATALPNRIMPMIDVVKQICMNAHEEQFSFIIKQSNNDPDVIRALSTAINLYFDRLMTRNPGSGIKALTAFIEAVTVQQFNLTDAGQIISKYVDTGLANPSACDFAALKHLLTLELDKATTDKITVLVQLHDGIIPTTVNKAIMLAAHRMGQKMDFTTQLYTEWLKSAPSIKEVAEYVTSAPGITPLIGHIIKITWGTGVIRRDREQYVLAILDNSQWRNEDRKSFAAICNDNELAKLISNSDNFFSKLSRKIFNRFK